DGGGGGEVAGELLDAEFFEGRVALPRQTAHGGTAGQELPHDRAAEEPAAAGDESLHRGYGGGALSSSARTLPAAVACSAPFPAVLARIARGPLPLPPPPKARRRTPPATNPQVLLSRVPANL